jgi:spermidine dehydrogenase
MTKKLNISRRDFLNGVALSVAAGSSLSPLELLAMTAKDGTPYPPALTGMRGAHPGSFEVAHALSWGGATWPRPDNITDDVYDLIVVGGGHSGLAAACFYRQRVGPDAKILILDNHDDFGGHSKRNEFEVDGKKLIGYGGCQSIDTPGHYSDIAKQHLKDIGIHTERFYDYFDREYFRNRNLGRAIYFSEESYGADSVQPNVTRGFGPAVELDVAKVVNNYPLSDESRKSMLYLLTEEVDYLEGRSRDEKIKTMRATSYTDFLKEHAGLTPEAATVFRDTIKGLWGVGWDALSALEGFRLGMPGTYGLGIGELENELPGRDEPYIFHFPDGNGGFRAIPWKIL